MEKLGDTSMSQSQVLGAIDEWLGLKLAKESKTALDTAECMRVFARTGNNLGQAIAYAEHLFKQQGTIQLMTGHKSKGLEFPLVYHLDPQIIGDGPQDKNLRYVIQTRSSNEYFEIASEAVEW
jgi:ATP-dependent exoDNAse (exonuclease V) beta subunit